MSLFCCLCFQVNRKKLVAFNLISKLKLDLMEKRKTSRMKRDSSRSIQSEISSLSRARWVVHTHRFTSNRFATKMKDWLRMIKINKISRLLSTLRSCRRFFETSAGGSWREIRSYSSVCWSIIGSYKKENQHTAHIWVKLASHSVKHERRAISYGKSALFPFHPHK